MKRSQKRVETNWRELKRVRLEVKRAQADCRGIEED